MTFGIEDNGLAVVFGFGEVGCETLFRFRDDTLVIVVGFEALFGFGDDGSAIVFDI